MQIVLDTNHLPAFVINKYLVKQPDEQRETLQFLTMEYFNFLT